MRLFNKKNQSVFITLRSKNTKREIVRNTLRSKIQKDKTQEKTFDFINQSKDLKTNY